MDTINNVVNEFIRSQKEYIERTLAEIIEKYDFVVSSMECKYELMKVLPEGANIICSPYIASPNMIYAIKKFDIMDLLKEPPKLELESKYKNLCDSCADKADCWLIYQYGPAESQCVHYKKEQ